MLAPEPRGESAAGETVDLVVIAPSPEQRRDARWTAHAADVAAARLSAVGVAYLVPGNAGRLGRALVGAGLQRAGTLLHVPDVPRTRYLVPVGTLAERYALAGRIAAGRWKRTVASGIGARGRATFGPTGAIYRRDPSSPLARWLFTLGGPDSHAAGSLIVALPLSGVEGAVLYRFGESEPVPNAVAKVSPRANDELRALERIAAPAGRAGARVPVALASGRLDAVPYVLESALSGVSAASLVASRRIQVEDIHVRVADWLEQWNRSSARVRPLGEDDAERFVLTPASKVRQTATDASYVKFLRALCGRAIGRDCPFVASHGDLTLANVLVHDPGPLGIVDWEVAAEEALPLTDFLYTAVDAVAARARYADRPGAFAACCSPGGRDASAVDRLQRRFTTALGLDDVVRELCFHACWLHHAANEAARSKGSTPGPFTTILQTIAAWPDRFGVGKPAR